MKTKRKVLIGTTLAIAVGAMAGGATLTANAMGTTNPESKVRAVVGTVTPAADGKGMISCTFTDVELPAIALSGDPATWVIGDAVDTTGDFSVSGAVPSAGPSEPGVPKSDTGIGPVIVKSTDGGATFTITNPDGSTETVTNPEPGTAFSVPVPAPAGTEPLPPLPALSPEGSLPAALPFDIGSGVAVDVRQGTEAECAAAQPGAPGSPALPLPALPAASGSTTKA